MVVLVLLVTLGVGLSASVAPVSAYLSHNYLHATASSILSEPDGMDFDAHGDLYTTVRGQEQREVARLNPSTGELVAFTAAEPYVTNGVLTGTPDGPFEGEGTGGFPDGVAVDRTSGDIYVAVDTYDPAEAGAVYVFNESGEYQFKISEVPATAPVHGPFVLPGSLTVDQQNGNLYATDVRAHVVDVYKANGEYLTQIDPGGTDVGVAVDDASGELYVATYIEGTGERIQAYNSAGVLVASWTGSNTPRDLLQGSSMYVDQSTGHVSSRRGIGQRLLDHLRVFRVAENTSRKLAGAQGQPDSDIRRCWGSIRAET